MITLEPFQEATVRTAVKALTAKRGTRRFLIADEVGLGKTVVASEIARRIGETRRLNVVYLCPNLDIATQNKDTLGKLDPSWIQPDDRLSLCVAEPSLKRSKFRIFSLTPDTSLPSWKSGVRTGKRTERELVAALVKRNWPNFWRKLHAADIARGRRLLLKPSRRSSTHLDRAFVRAVRDTFALGRSPTERGLQTWLSNWGVSEFVSLARSALALVALRSARVRPDLIILDEFHRYADLVVEARATGTRKRRLSERTKKLQKMHAGVHLLLKKAFLGYDRINPPAVLLLSATPYRLHRLDGGDIAFGRRYAGLADVVKFLRDVDNRDSDRVQRLIGRHHAALLAQENSPEVLRRALAAKRQLERLLRPVIARTERALVSSKDLFQRISYPTTVSTPDLEVFRHFSKAVHDYKPRLTSWVTPLWSSVPYPAQTLFEYKVCSAVVKSAPPRITLEATSDSPAHPQYRSLVQAANGEPPIDRAVLRLPWLPPTLPWWRLGGAWKSNGRTVSAKALLFSQYRASPSSLSALLSLCVDNQGLQTDAGSHKFSAQAYFRLKESSPSPTVAFFMPWPNLASAIDPSKGAENSISQVRKRAELDLEAWLGQPRIGISVDRKCSEVSGRQRSEWQLAVGIEARLGGQPSLLKALGSLKKVRAGWAKVQAIDSVSPNELQKLANYLLSSPGAVIARALQRHAPSLVKNSFPEVFKFSWNNMRTYLGQRYFATTVLGSRLRSQRRHDSNYPKALSKAILEGGLESVLDEHITVLRLVLQKTDIQILKELSAGLLDRPGSVRIRHGRKIVRLRVHAALPFSGAERHSGPSGTEEKLRSDSVRRAFNSPFWPHVLSTTSVGQEGLDFHLWSDRVIHWDIPRDPVEFEQREGRICRYASLTVRRALAQTHGSGALAAARGTSPFAEVFGSARATTTKGLGLEKWWTPESILPVSVTFRWQFSLRSRQLEHLKQELLRYRLALGQPEPEAFMGFISRLNLDADSARGLAIDLCPAQH